VSKGGGEKSTPSYNDRSQNLLDSMGIVSAFTVWLLGKELEQGYGGVAGFASSHTSSSATYCVGDVMEGSALDYRRQSCRQ